MADFVRGFLPVASSQMDITGEDWSNINGITLSDGYFVPS